MQAVRPQLLAQEPNRRLSAGQVEAYLYIWSLGVASGSGVDGAILSHGNARFAWCWSLGPGSVLPARQRLSDAAGTCVARKDRRWCQWSGRF